MGNEEYTQRISKMRELISSSQHHELMGRHQAAFDDLHAACEVCPNELSFMFSPLRAKLHELNNLIPKPGIMSKLKFSRQNG